MGESKIRFKTNSDQPLKKSIRKKSGISAYLSGKRKPIKTVEVDINQQRNQRIIWVLKWVLLLPLSVYVLSWVILLIIDTFVS